MSSLAHSLVTWAGFLQLPERPIASDRGSHGVVVAPDLALERTAARLEQANNFPVFLLHADCRPDIQPRHPLGHLLADNHLVQPWREAAALDHLDSVAHLEGHRRHTAKRDVRSEERRVGKECRSRW